MYNGFKHKIESIKTIVIAILLFWIFLLSDCNNTNKPYSEDIKIINTTDTIRDTTLITKTIKKPIPYPVYTRVEIPQKVDTSEIIKKYFTIAVINDTLKDDSVAFISLIDTLKKNTLSARILKFKLRKPTIINNETTYITKEYPPKNQLLFGGNIQGNESSFDIGGGLSLITHKGNQLDLGYMILSNRIQVGYKKRLFMWKIDKK